MPKIGLKLPKYCTITGDTEIQGTGKAMAKAIKADVKINVTDIKLYADDDIDENIKEFKDGSITQEINDLSDEVSAELLGHTILEGELTANGNDIAPFVRVGFISRIIKGNVVTFKAIVFMKVKYGIPDETYETKGESTAFKTSTIVGTIYRNKDGVWKKQKAFATEELAVAYLNGLVNVVVTP